MNIYLDACCLNRPFDDQAIARNRIEAEAVQAILDEVSTGRHVMIGSDVLDAELSQIRDADRRDQVRALLSLQTLHVPVTLAEETRMRELVALGFKAMDALHVACAEHGGAVVMLTTDDKLLNRASGGVALVRVRVENPAAWVLGGMQQ